MRLVKVSAWDLTDQELDGVAAQCEANDLHTPQNCDTSRYGDGNMPIRRRRSTVAEAISVLR